MHQGSQFSAKQVLCRDSAKQVLCRDSAGFTGLLIRNDIKISMDGNGAWRDSVFVERIWREVKYEEI